MCRVAGVQHSIGITMSRNPHQLLPVYEIFSQITIHETPICETLAKSINCPPVVNFDLPTDWAVPIVRVRIPQAITPQHIIDCPPSLITLAFNSRPFDHLKAGLDDIMLIFYFEDTTQRQHKDNIKQRLLVNSRLIYIKD